MKLFTISCLCLLLCCFKARSQSESAPTLTIGLNGLVGGAGNIDVEVLSEIITTKQDEFKKEAIQVLLRNYFKNGSYTFYSFSNQCISNLLENKEATATKRKLVENLANLSMVYGFSEFYLRTSHTLMSNKDLKEVIEASTENMINPDIRAYWLKRLVSNPINLGNLNHTKDEINAMLTSIESPDYESILQNNYDTIIPHLKEFKHLLNKKFNDSIETQLPSYKSFASLSSFMLNQLKPLRVSDKNIALNEILIDLVYDIMIQSSELEKLGFFKVSRQAVDEEYRVQNKYLYVINQANNEALKAELNISPANLIVLRKCLLSLRNRIENEVKLLLNNYLMVKELMRKEMSIEDLEKHYLSRCPSINYKTFPEKIQVLVDKVNLNLHSITDKDSKLKNDSLLLKINAYIKFLKEVKNRQSFAFNDNDIKFIKETLFPINTKLIELQILDGEDDKSLSELYSFMWYKKLNDLLSILNKSPNKYLAKISLTTFSDFMELLSNLGSLDKAKTYDEVFKLVMNAGYLYDNASNTQVFNFLIGTIEKYASIDEEKNKIDLNVEMIITALYDKWAKRTSSCLSFYFTVGINNSKGGLFDDPSLAGTRAKNFSFVSEKIGVKLKYLNFEKKRNNSIHSDKSKNPLINNLNFTLYGSGLLYNIVNTTNSTQERFKYPMIGFATGAELFNALEFNVFYALPQIGNDKFFKEAKNNYLIGIAFDFPIAEYLTAVQKKRKEAKLKEAQDEAEKNETTTEAKK